MSGRQRATASRFVFVICDWTIEQDHRTVKKRTWLAKGYNTFQSAWRTIEGIETVSMIRKGRVRWVAKEDVIAEARFIAKLFGLAA
jgi:transposase, IS6 family